MRYVPREWRIQQRGRHPFGTSDGGRAAPWRVRVLGSRWRKDSGHRGAALRTAVIRATRGALEVAGKHRSNGRQSKFTADREVRRVVPVSTWLSTGAVTVGLGAAVLASAGLAHADTEHSEGGASSTSAAHGDAGSGGSGAGSATGGGTSESAGSVASSAGGPDSQGLASTQASAGPRGARTATTAGSGSAESNVARHGAVGLTQA